MMTVREIKATKTKNLKAFYAAALAVLFAYAVLGMFLLPSSPFLPLLTAAVIILVDALVFSLVALGLYINPPVVVALLTGIRLGGADLDAAMRQLDADGSGSVDFAELYRWCVAVQKPH